MNFILFKFIKLECSLVLAFLFFLFDSFSLQVFGKNAVENKYYFEAVPILAFAPFLIVVIFIYWVVATIIAQLNLFPAEDFSWFGISKAEISAIQNNHNVTQYEIDELHRIVRLCYSLGIAILINFVQIERSSMWGLKSNGAKTYAKKKF
jgi:hypothetical protein